MLPWRIRGKLIFFFFFLGGGKANTQPTNRINIQGDGTDNGGSINVTTRQYMDMGTEKKAEELKNQTLRKQ